MHPADDARYKKKPRGFAPAGTPAASLAGPRNAPRRAADSLATARSLPDDESRFPDPWEPNQPTLTVPEDDLRDQRFERVAARAFELYEARGGEHGQDIADWLQAERQIDEEIGQFDAED